MIVLSKLLPVFVFPVGLTLLFIALGLLFRRLERPRLTTFSLVFAFTVLYLFSTAPVAGFLAKRLERRYLPVEPASIKADVIVVLGGAGRPKAYPRRTVEFGEGAERIFEGIRLYKAGVAPVVIPTGGGISFIAGGQREGSDLKSVMVEFGVPEGAVIAEDSALNTYQNATRVKAILESRGIGKRVALVTSAMHMVRSVPIFRKAGFEVIPVPCDYLAEDVPINWYHCLPQAPALLLSTQALKEQIGIAAYTLLGWM